MATADGTPDLFRRVIIGAIVLAIGLTIVSQLVSVGGVTSIGGSVSVGGDNSVDLNGATNITSVSDSTGRAAAVDSGTEVQVSGGIGVDGSQWHWSTFTSVTAAENDQVIWSVRDDWILAYNASDASSPRQWVLWYYNSSSTNTYRLTVPASSPTALTNIQAERNASTLRLYNGTGGTSSLTLSPSTASSAPAPADNELVGTLEETRTWDRPLSSSERQTVRNDPLAPVGVGDRDARLMFDKDSRDVAVDLRAASGEIVGSPGFFSSVRTNGIPGSELQRGVDFEVQNGAVVCCRAATCSTRRGSLSKRPARSSATSCARSALRSRSRAWCSSSPSPAASSAW
jgi:hypothetical protein